MRVAVAVFLRVGQCRFGGVFVGLVGRQHPASTSTVAPPPATRAVKDPSIPGIGATRDDWDASHTPNPIFNNDSVYGYDPSLPEYYAPNGGVYVEVIGDKTIQGYVLNMHEVDRDEALARARQELPFDATPVWDLKLDQCNRVQFYSPTVPGIQHMAVVQLQEAQKGGPLAFNPHTFNQVSFDLDVAGAKPDPDIGC